MRNGTSPNGIVELELWAPYDGVVIARVSNAVTAVAWISMGRAFDRMAPVKQWIVEVGRVVPKSQAASLFSLSQGALVAYGHGKILATLVVKNSNILPPAVLPTTPCP